MPKVLRRDLVLFQVGTSYKKIRKDRDNWKLDERSDDEITLYYEDIRPNKVLGVSL